MILSLESYRVMPWANGMGTTTEILREEGEGGMRLRLSMATVAADGPFSLFPGIDRILTVIEGPGFALRGPGHDLRADPLRPVAFPGDVEIAATGVTAPAIDFNVMIARGLGAARVAVLGPDEALAANGARLALFALADCQLAIGGQDTALPRHVTLLRPATRVENRGPGTVLAITLPF